MLHRLSIFFLFISLMVLWGCGKENTGQAPELSGKVAFNFRHSINGEPLQQDALIYTNEAGNQYMVTEVQYFISDVTFYHQGGTKTMIEKWSDIFYIDEDIPSSKTILFFDPVPVGVYDSITFTFGIPESKNHSFMYVNPPEVYMAWPQVLGGGYHYMMINGKWKDIHGVVLPFDFHLGIGQLYKGITYHTDSIYAFVQNYFHVRLPGSGFTLERDEVKTINLQMNIESWFKTPFIYNHDQWGGAIMQNQEAMQMVKDNGYDVFTISGNGNSTSFF